MSYPSACRGCNQPPSVDGHVTQGETKTGKKVLNCSQCPGRPKTDGSGFWPLTTWPDDGAAKRQRAYGGGSTTTYSSPPSKDYTEELKEMQAKLDMVIQHMAALEATMIAQNSKLDNTLKQCSARAD